MRRAIAELGIERVALIDGIEHYSDEQADAIRGNIDAPKRVAVTGSQGA